MQRPKQQALAFLLGALLVGGVVGFSANRVLGQKDNTEESRRAALYDDLGLATVQRATVDSVFDASDCQFESLFKPMKPAIDSLKASRRAQMNAVLTPEQRTRLEARRKDEKARRDAEPKRVKPPCPK